MPIVIRNRADLEIVRWKVLPKRATQSNLKFTIKHKRPELTLYSFIQNHSRMIPKIAINKQNHPETGQI